MANQNLEKHESSVHKGIMPFKCNICHHRFTDKYMLNQHVSTVHAGNKPYKCDLCSSSFSQKDSLKTHKSSVHEEKSHSSAIYALLVFHEKEI